MNERVIPEVTLQIESLPTANIRDILLHFGDLAKYYQPQSDELYIQRLIGPKEPLLEILNIQTDAETTSENKKQLIHNGILGLQQGIASKDLKAIETADKVLEYLITELFIHPLYLEGCERFDQHVYALLELDKLRHVDAAIATQEKEMMETFKHIEAIQQRIQKMIIVRKGLDAQRREINGESAN